MQWNCFRQTDFIFHSAHALQYSPASFQCSRYRRCRKIFRKPRSGGSRLYDSANQCIYESFIGVSLGANVLAARFYATKQEKQMSETVHTAVTFALISGIVMVFVGLFFSKAALLLMDTPSDVIGQSALYMRIYFAGMPFFMLYNYGAAILRAVGDTKRPLFFLIIAGIVNAALNLFLVIVLHPESRSCNRHSDRTDDLLSPCPSLSISLGRKLSTSIFRNDNQVDLFKANFSGRYSRRHTKYGYQLLKRTSSIFGKLFWFYRNGRLYSCK